MNVNVVVCCNQSPYSAACSVPAQRAEMFLHQYTGGLPRIFTGILVSLLLNAALLH